MDGNYFNEFHYFYEDRFYTINHETMIKGDALCKAISAASILAKVQRDVYIEEFIQENPDYEEKYKLSSNKALASINDSDQWSFELSW